MNVISRIRGPIVMAAIVCMAALAACGEASAPATPVAQHAGAQADAAIECGGKPGWQRARAITPDVVPPCFSGSGGICAEGFGYVRSSGWCRPLDGKAQAAAKTQERK
ncbi:hypothetical protein [Dokdonella sp.]|uniref:hypothetical protein n=1 Tax=Dokdonella sp. TaxID=2291710 RepID=UPI0025B8AFF6|nr:hypothetical protein [Dokdonella sp.]MBX3688532.1 hypothetical protein [Dokdonella sp.]